MIEAFLERAFGRDIVDMTILDVGCGNGGIGQYFSEKNHVVGVDVEDKRRAEARNFEFRCVESSDLPFDDATFDVVLSHHVIEHLPDQPGHLKEIYRVLRSNGVAYIGTPNKSSPMMEGHLNNDWVLRYREMEPLFRKYGFHCELLSLSLASEPSVYYGEMKWGRYMPRMLLKLILPWYPSHYYLLRKSESVAL